MVGGILNAYGFGEQWECRGKNTIFLITILFLAQDVKQTIFVMYKDEPLHHLRSSELTGIAVQ